MLKSRWNALWLAWIVCSVSLFSTPGSAGAQYAAPQYPVAQGAPAAAPTRGFVQRVFKDDAGEHKYAVFVPAAYNAQQAWPVILFLHGAGECGNDGRAQLTVGLGPIIQRRAADFPFIAVFPQCQETRERILTRWLAGSPDSNRALRILAEVEKNFNVNPRQRILTGWSMGGYGAWSLAAAHPKSWAAVVPLAGGGDVAWGETLAETPIWALHGAADRAVPASASRDMIEAIQKAGGRPYYSEIPGGDHDVWKVAYSDPELFRWMRNSRTTPDLGSPLKVAAALASNAIPSVDAPFVPAVSVPNAVYVRLGNEMLAAVADSVPSMIPQSALSGGLADIYDSTSAEGYTFGVTFSGISYNGQIVRAALKAYAPERVNVQLQLRNISLSIGSTSIAGGRKSAVAGPMGIYIAHNYPLWLSFDVRPYLDKGRIRFQLLGTRFSIPGDNYSVSGPAGVSTHGLGMTSERVSSGLVSGLYGARGRIEQQIVGVIPSLLVQLEQYMKLDQVDHLVGGVWPMPVYQPRVRTWAQEISTDAQGVTIVMGLSAASPIPNLSPAQPPVAHSAGLDINKIERGTQFRVGISPGILTPLSKMLVDADLARINVLDTPIKAFAAYTDPKVLAEAIPDLKRYGDDVRILAELIVTEPLKVGGEKDDAGPKLDFGLAGLKIALSIKPDATAKQWTPYADLVFNLDQQAEPELIKPTSQTRALILKWTADANLVAEAKFAADYKPEDEKIDTEALQRIFTEGWTEWTQQGPASQMRIPDIDLAGSKLRVKKVDWSAPFLNAQFGPAGVRLTNSTDSNFVFETKGPNSGWSQPYTLAPGQSDYFNIPYPLLFRRQSAAGVELYTLPAGSHSELIIPKSGGPPRVYQAREKKVEAPAITEQAEG